VRVPGLIVYASSKWAIALGSPGGDDGGVGGAGIPINAIAPGIVATPMTQDPIDDPAGTVVLQEAAPMPLGRRTSPPCWCG
jgi:NAD(P)-dependent dehydrogenase (short-subunit alcohol dehydrogenase family)